MSLLIEEKEYTRPYALVEGKVLKKYIADKSGVVHIPENVEVIASCVFSWNGMPEEQFDYWEAENDQTITEIYIPATVKKIEVNAFANLFYLRKLVIDKNCPAVVFEDEVVYSADKKRIIFAAPTIKKSYCIPNGVVTIEPFSFEERSINTVIIPNTVKTIGDGAFSHAYMNKIIIPDSVTEIGEDIFSFCYLRYDNIEINENSPVLQKNDFGIFTKDGKNLLYVFDNETGKYIVPDGVTNIERFAFTDPFIEEVVISEGVKILRDETFLWNLHLKTIVLPDTLEVIGTDVFTSCKKLTTVKMPKNLVEIKPYAFNDCENLELLELPASLKMIGKNAFINCDKLTIVAPKGSYAIQYAKENGIKHKELM